MTREEAIERIEFLKGVYSVDMETALGMAIEALKDRPHGEWKQTITWQPYCSNCEYVFGEDEEFSPFWKYCPMCGAEMADNSLVNDITESPNDVIESQNDVIEVVLCKDCKWHKLTDNNETEVCTNKQWDISMAVYPIISADDFCSYGERR